MTVKLKGEYLSVARAPESSQAVSEALPPEHADNIALKKIREGAHELGGIMSITINCTKN